MNSMNEAEIKDAVTVTGNAGVSRRNFLQLAGGATAASLLLAACRRSPSDLTYIGAGDVAALNYLYILESVLSAFYVQANLTPYYGMDKSELELLADMRDHQLAHKGLIKSFLKDNAINNFVVDLSPVTFADRTDTLTKAFQLEDLAVGAYIGITSRFKDTNYIVPIAKMATVQARHSAYARQILTANSFTDSTIVDANGLGQSLAPAVVMNALQPYILTKLNLVNLPA